MENLPKYKKKMKDIILQKLYLTLYFYRKWKTYQNTKRK